MTDEQADKIIKELEILRKLGILEFIDKGYSQAQLAEFLGVSQPTISRMFPKGVAKKKSGSDD